jgi:hypothetical protein
MYPSRAELSKGKRVPETWPEWTLPVVYVQEGPMRLKARPRTGEAQVAAQAASVASIQAPGASGTGAIGETFTDPPTTLTRASRFVLRLEKLGDLRTELRALGAPAALVAAFDVEIANAAHDFAATERDTLVQSLDALKGAEGVSSDMVDAFYSALSELDDKIAIR